jgi:arylformamidase
MADRRVQFDFEVDFSNGGGIQGQGFRLDLNGENIDDAALADYIVRDLRLLMVGEVRILNKAIIEEAHKRTTDGLVELSHVIKHGMITYQGLPAPIICDFLSREASREIYAEGTEFQIGKIELCSNTGTYIDSPFHRFPDTDDLADLKLAQFADLEGLCISVAGQEGRAVGPDAFAAHEVRDRAVLVHTGWDAHWRTDQYFTGHPFLTKDAAEHLRDRGARLVGIDSLNIDDTDDGFRPVHTALLGADIPIVEHLRGLEQLPATGFRFTAAPPAVRGMGTFPVRAFAVLSG